MPETSSILAVTIGVSMGVEANGNVSFSLVAFLQLQVIKTINTL
jgi:hypothetical protein